MTHHAWFKLLTGHDTPRPWQADLASAPACRDRLIRIPTGLGKTEGVLAAWSFHRIRRNDDYWPRRLVWCLPMRVLVEQTEQVARDLAERMPGEDRPTVHVAMGGEDAGDWFLHPERPAIIIGTQDMLLSRALNRGYASARARWPMEFGLLNQDALWIMDEVQLMDVGLATSAQLQAFRADDRERSVRPCHTWWMSATLQPQWLHSVDTADHHGEWTKNPCAVPGPQRTGGLWDVRKSLATEAIGHQDHRTFAQRILTAHANVAAGPYGRITLVVCNTVDRACATFEALNAAGHTGEIELVHSRFRPAERESWRERFLSRSACTPAADRIIVATQVVEAGVDVSATCLLSELAPWPSLVQRFGRCARYGGNGTVVVVDRGRDDAVSAPYESEQLDAAWDALQQLTEQGVGIATLEAFEEALSGETRNRLYPYAPAHLLLRREFDELFDTTPDLTGADLDISRFIRSSENERDLQVCWIEVPKPKKGEQPKKPPEDYKAQRAELCAIPFLKAREWLCEKGKSRLKANKRAWVWDWLDGEWKVATSESLLPGRVVCVASDSGGYLIDRGFSPNSSAQVAPAPRKVCENTIADKDDDQEESEQRSFTGWKTIACHTAEVTEAVKALARQLNLSSQLAVAFEFAAVFHDWGKSHLAFQNMLFRKRQNVEKLRNWAIAKSKRVEPPIKARYFTDADETDERRSFRHELASALGLFSLLRTYAPQHPALLGPWADVLAKLNKPTPSGEPPAPLPLVQRLIDCSPEAFDLIAYLVASHHGKVRAGLHASPKDQEYRVKPGDNNGLPIRGVRENDRLPSTVLIPGEPPVPEVTLTLAPAGIGLSDRTGISWRERCLGLLDRYGPTGLAFLEAVLRAADVRASCLTTDDPTCVAEGQS